MTGALPKIELCYIWGCCIPEFQINYLSWALWFVLPFLLVSIVLPFFYRFFKNKNMIVKFSPLIIFALLVYMLDILGKDLGILKCFLLYSFFTYLGLFYDYFKIKKNRSCLIMSFVIALMFGIIFLSFNIYSLDMQVNKFDYNFLFLIYNLGILVVINLGIDGIIKLGVKFENVKIIGKLFYEYERNSYMIFLWHPVVFLIVDKILVSLVVVEKIQRFQFLFFTLFFLMMWLICGIVGKLFSSLQNIRKVKRIKV